MHLTLSHPLRGSKMHVTPSTFFIMVMNLLPLTSASTSFIHLQPGHLHHYRPWPYLGPTAWLPPSIYYIPKHHSAFPEPEWSINDIQEQGQPENKNNESHVEARLGDIG